MTYNEFLMSQVLRDNSKKHRDMPYDNLFETAIDELELFEYSDYNLPDKGLYECLVEYVDEELR